MIQLCDKTKIGYVLHVKYSRSKTALIHTKTEVF
jgi:hypothetical protein